MKKKRTNAEVGDLVKIPFRPGVHTYGRILIDGSYAIYDCPSTKDTDDYEKVITSEILFIAYVDIFALKEEYWEIITNIPLEENLKNFYPRYFNPSPFRKENVNFYEVYKLEIEDAIDKDWIKTGKLQLHGIHGHMHVESRINDYYNGKKNEYNRMNILVFKRHLGIHNPG